MPNVLVLDTSTNACSVAVQSGEATATRFEIAPRRHTDLLLAMVDACLLEAGISLEQLDVMGCAVGPGSFMGVRLAVSVVQALGLGVSVPTVGLSTLQLLAQTVAAKSDHVLACWDARMGEVYWGAYQAVNGVMQMVAPDQLLLPENVPVMEGSWYKGGNGWAVCGETVEGRDDYPNAEAGLTLAAQALAAGFCVPAKDLLPLYLRNNVTG